jgi:hypothetical protein
LGKQYRNRLRASTERVVDRCAGDRPELRLGDHIQLTLQTSLAILKRSDQGAVAGIGGTEAAIKWHFLDQGRNIVDMSMFPRIIFNITPSSVRRGLSEDGTRFQIPFQVAKNFGPIDLDFEFGPLVSTVGRSEFLYGIVGGTEVSKRTTIMAELRGTSHMNFTRDTVTLNFGWRHKLNEHAIWIGSLGHELRTPGDEQLALIGYCGVQLVY